MGNSSRSGMETSWRDARASRQSFPKTHALANLLIHRLTHLPNVYDMFSVDTGVERSPGYIIKVNKRNSAKQQALCIVSGKRESG